MIRPIALSLPLLLALAACSSDGAREASEPARTPVDRGGSGDRYVVAFLVSGPSAAEVSAEELRALMAGHFENMGALAEAGRLLVAGPFGQPRADPALRGLFLFDTSELETARRWAATDPAVAAGVLEARLHPLQSAAPLRELPRLEREDEARRLARDPDSKWEGRSYVLLTAADAAAADRALAGHPLAERVLVRGELAETRDGARDAEVLYVLDVADLDELGSVAAGLLDDPAPGWSRHPWYSTRMVAELRSR